MLSKFGAVFETSCKSLRVSARVGAAAARSSSGPRGATFLFSVFPTSPLTLEVTSHGATIRCHFSEGVSVNQISKLVVGKTRSSGSMARRLARYASSMTNAAQLSSTPRCCEISFKSRTPSPPERRASAGSCAQKFKTSSTQRSTVEILAIAASAIFFSSLFSPSITGHVESNSRWIFPPRR